MSERDTTYVQQALSANNTEFTPDALELAQGNSFDRILAQLDEQASIQRNEASPTPAGESPDGTRTLYVSSSGFSSLFDAAPRTLYVPEGKGARARGAEILDGRQVDQVVLHSFGYTIDRTALRAGAQSIQVDNRDTGHNPYKVYNRLQQVLFQERQSTTHLVTRRGDIISACPWNRAPAVNRSRAAGDLRADLRSISIELESWHTSYRVPFRGTPEGDFRVLGLMPYTPQQITAVAFLLKKLALWSNQDVMHVLGFTLNDVRTKVGTGSNHVPGIVPFSAYAGNQPHVPGGEFLLPLDYKLGDALPAHLQDQQALWNRRFDLYYRSIGLADGALLSHYAAIKTVYDMLPAYSFQTELFEERGDVLFTTAQPVGTVNVPADIAVATAGEGYARAQQMQAAVRSGLYDASGVATDAVITATAEYTARQLAARSTTVTVPVIRNSLAFDFATGRWVIATTRAVPDPANVHIQAAGGDA